MLKMILFFLSLEKYISKNDGDTIIIIIMIEREKGRGNNNTIILIQ